MPEPDLPKRPGFESAWRARFEEFASLRDDDAGIAGWSSSGLEVRFRHFLRVWRQSEHGHLWLDAGCGAGTYARFLTGQGAEVLGLDYSLPTVVKARARDDGRCAWAVADVTQLPLPPGRFDGVVCFGVTQALADSAPAVRELAAQIRSGGELWIDVLNRNCVANALQRLSRWLRGKPAHLRYESPRRVRELMRQSGMQDVRIHWIPIVPGRLGFLQGIAETRVLGSIVRMVPGLGDLLSHSCMLTGRKPVVEFADSFGCDARPPADPQHHLTNSQSAR